MSNEISDGDKPPKSNIISDTNFTFNKGGAGLTVEGYDQTVTTRSNFVGGDGAVFKAHTDPPPQTAPEPAASDSPPQVHPLAPIIKSGALVAVGAFLGYSLSQPFAAQVLNWCANVAGALLAGYLIYLFGWNTKK